VKLLQIELSSSEILELTVFTTKVCIMQKTFTICWIRGQNNDVCWSSLDWIPEGWSAL